MTVWTPGGTLAHAFLPRRGEAHFDRAERWTLNGHKGHNLFMVAAHEIGHTLGLEHSPVRHALMSPYYRRLGASLVLSWDDVVAVQQLYGEIHNSTRHPNLEPIPTPTAFKPRTAKAAFMFLFCFLTYFNYFGPK